MMPVMDILDIFNIQSNLENLKSGTRDFILKYREFELAYREKNIKNIYFKNDYYQCFSLSNKYFGFFHAHKT